MSSYFRPDQPGIRSIHIKSRPPRLWPSNPLLCPPSVHLPESNPPKLRPRLARVPSLKRAKLHNPSHLPRTLQTKLSTSSSQKSGFGPVIAAKAFKILKLNVQGYDNFVTQGGDWGAFVTRSLAMQYPQHVRACHTNYIPCALLV